LADSTGEMNAEDCSKHISNTIGRQSPGFMLLKVDNSVVNVDVLVGIEHATS
jgi:hypothetical protein